jgi:hypothetical protein
MENIQAADRHGGPMTASILNNDWHTLAAVFQVAAGGMLIFPASWLIGSG